MRKRHIKIWSKGWSRACAKACARASVRTWTILACWISISTGQTLLGNSAVDSACSSLERAIEMGESKRSLDLDDARRYLNEQESLSAECSDLGLRLDYMELQATVCYLMADYEAAAQWSQREIDLCMDAGLPGKLGLILNGKAHFLSRFKQWDKSHAYLDQALPLCMEAQDTFCWSMNLDTRGIVLMRQERIDEAGEYFQRCLELREQHRDTVGLGYVCENLCWVALESGRLEEALGWIRKAYRFRLAKVENSALASNITNIGEVHQAMGRCDSAILYYERAYALGHSLGYQDLKRHVLEQLALCARQAGDWEAAYGYLQRSDALEDSMFTADQQQAIARMEAEYDAALREQRIAIQALEIQQQRNRNRYQRIGALALLVLMLSLGGWVWQRNRARTERRMREAELTFQEGRLRHSIEVQEAERKRIARDLHDGIGQRLGGLKLSWSRLTERLNRVLPEEQADMQRLTGILDETAQEVRSLSHQMMPRALSAVGLSAALNDLVEQQFRNSGIQVRMEEHGASGRFDERVEIALYRMAQEMLGNILKHAGATQVDVQLMRSGKRLILIVEDNGRGFDPQRMRAGTGHGLANLQSRAAAVGGDVVFEASPGNGTVVRVRVPLDPKPAVNLHSALN